MRTSVALKCLRVIKIFLNLCEFTLLCNYDNRSAQLSNKALSQDFSERMDLPCPFIDDSNQSSSENTIRRNINQASKGFS